MGAIAEGFMAFSKPLLDQSDGTQEGMQKALSLGQFCHNLALLPDDDRIEMLAEAQQAFGLDDAEFAEFRKGIVAPMLERHRQMFPLMHQRVSPGCSFGDGPMLWDDRATTAAPAKTKPKVESRPLRTVPLWQRQKIQVLLRRERPLKSLQQAPHASGGAARAVGSARTVRRFPASSVTDRNIPGRLTE